MNKKLFSRLTLTLTAVAVLIPLTLWSLPNFSVEDQYEKKHTQNSLKGKVVIIIAADKRKLSSSFLKWLQQIKKTVKKPVIVRGILGFDKDPGSIGSFFIKRGFKKKKYMGVRVYLDWTKRVFKKFGFPNNTVSVMVFNRGGKKVKLVRGPYTAACLKQIKAAAK